MRRFYLTSVLVLLLCGAAGCDRDVGDLHIDVVSDPDRPPISAGATDVRVRVEADDIGVVTREFPIEAGATLAAIPVGDNRVVTVEALASTSVQARGRSGPITIKAGVNRLELYMGPVGRFSGSAPGISGAPRGGHHAVAMADGRVLLIGGTSSNTFDAAPVASADLFDPTSGQLVAVGDCSPPDEAVPGSEPLCLRTPRTKAGIGRTERGDVIVAGGENESRAVASQAERLSPRGRNFGEAGDPIAERLDAAFVTVPGGALLLGGRQGDSTYLNSAVLFNESGERNETIERVLFCPRADATAAVVGDRVVLFGGNAESGTRHDFEILALAPELRSEGCFPIDADVTARVGAVATVIDHRFVVLTGGVDETGAASSEIDVLDVYQYVVCSVGSLERERSRHAAVRLPDGSVLVVAGNPTVYTEVLEVRSAMSALEELADCTALGESSMNLREGPRLIRPRIAPTATMMSNEMVLVAGGFDSEGNALDTYEVYVP